MNPLNCFQKIGNKNAIKTEIGIHLDFYHFQKNLTKKSRSPLPGVSTTFYQPKKSVSSDSMLKTTFFKDIGT
jgi:hypothetical protein